MLLYNEWPAMSPNVWREIEQVMKFMMMRTGEEVAGIVRPMLTSALCVAVMPPARIQGSTTSDGGIAVVYLVYPGMTRLISARPPEHVGCCCVQYEHKRSHWQIVGMAEASNV